MKFIIIMATMLTTSSAFAEWGNQVWGPQTWGFVTPPDNVANLGITKTNPAGGVVLGSSITYTIVASNAGPADVIGALVEDTIPAALSNASWTCSPAAGASCVGSGNGSISETVDIPNGGSVTFALTADVVDPGFIGSIINLATVTPPVDWTDPFPDDNTATNESFSDMAFNNSFEVCAGGCLVRGAQSSVLWSPEISQIEFFGSNNSCTSGGGEPYYTAAAVEADSLEEARNLLPCNAQGVTEATFIESCRVFFCDD